MILGQRSPISGGAPQKNLWGGRGKAWASPHRAGRKSPPALFHPCPPAAALALAPGCSSVPCSLTRPAPESCLPVLAIPGFWLQPGPLHGPVRRSVAPGPAALFWAWFTAPDPVAQAHGCSSIPHPDFSHSLGHGSRPLTAALSQLLIVASGWLRTR